MKYLARSNVNKKTLLSSYNKKSEVHPVAGISLVI